MNALSDTRSPDSISQIESAASIISSITSTSPEKCKSPDQPESSKGAEALHDGVTHFPPNFGNRQMIGRLETNLR